MEKQQKVNRMTKVHNARFYKIKPRSIERMTYSEILSKLAIARNDHSIEIWNLESCPVLETIIPKAPGISVEDLIWSGKRLFSVGLTGFLVEWNLRNLKVKNKLYATGNAIWCVDRSPNGNQLAIGTEEGYITIYNISNNDMIYEKLLDKQSERIVCLKFDHTGEQIVAGSVGFIRVWNVESGRSVTKMTMGRVYRRRELIVWSIHVLSDFTILSGDSQGYVTVWDGHMGAHIESHQALKADVLTLSVNAEENLFVASGVEPIIKIYTKTLIKRDDSECYRWVKCLQRRVHEHDIKSLIIFDNRVMSGSTDGFWGVSSVLRSDPNIYRYGPFLKSPCAVAAPEKRLVLVRYPSHIEVWSPGQNMDNTIKPFTELKDYSERNTLPLAHLPKKLVEIKSKNDHLILSASISPNSKWISFSTLYETKLLNFSLDTSQKPQAQLKPLKNLPEEFKEALFMQYSSDSKRLFIVQADTYDILIFDLKSEDDGSQIEFVERVNVSKVLKEPVIVFTVSPCSLYLAIATLDKKIGIWHAKNGKSFDHYLNLPRYSAPATALAFHRNSPLIVATYSDSKIIEYDYLAKRFTVNETTYFVENANSHYIQNICLDANNPNILVFQNDSYLFALEKVPSNQHIDNEQPAYKVTRSEELPQSSSQESNYNEPFQQYRLKFKLEKSYEHLLQICPLGSNEIFALIVNLESLLQSMPAMLKTKKFGLS